MNAPAYRLYCSFCDSTFSKPKQLEFHVNEKHRCALCNFQSSSSRDLKVHRKSHKLEPISHFQKGRKRKHSKFHYPFKETRAFSGFLKTYRHLIKSKHDICSVQDYFNLYRTSILNILEESLKNIRSIKFQISLHCEFVRENEVMTEIENEICHHYVNSELKVALNKFYVPEIFKEIILKIQHSADLFEKNGSGWQFNKVLGCDIRIAEFVLFRGGCTSFPVPKQFKAKRAIVSPQNSNNECFKYAFLIQMHYDDVPTYRRGNCSQYDKFKNIYNWDSIKLPTSIRHIARFEKDNQDKKFAVNVWGIDSEQVLNIKYQSQFCRDKTRKVVNILYVQRDHSSDGHYMAITQISRLLGKDSHHLRELCYNCFNTFTPNNLEAHENLCFQFKHQRIEMPEDRECRFKDIQKRLKTRFVIYADFESMCTSPSKKSIGQANLLNEHEPSGYCLAISDSYAKKKDKIKYSLYRGANSMNLFLKELYQVSETLLIENEKKKPMQKLSKAQLRQFKNSQTCHICQFKLQNSEKVKDHCHVTGKFRGAAHHSCNAQFIQPKRIPVVMHSFKSFDLQLLLSNISKFPEETVDVIPNNSEKFLSIITSSFYFIDSLMHLSASLETLVKNLNPKNSSEKDFRRNFRPMIKTFGSSKAKALCRKGVYPYEFMSSFEKFKEKTFPNQTDFYNSLTGNSVEDLDYTYGKSIFDKYCSNMGDYHDIYLLTDTLLLLCVMDKWRVTARQSYGLDPVHYYSLPGFAWDAALFNSKQTLELISDQSIYNFLELGLRGGVSMISHRYAKANNRFMKDFDETKPSSFIFYIDKTQLYAEAMSDYLPVGDFKWENKNLVKNITDQDILKWEPESSTGRILSVDLEYDVQLHALSSHSEYPLCPEKINIPERNLSSYQKKLIQNLDIKYSDKQTKLTPHLGDRNSYILHYRNLQYYLQKGMKLKKINSIVSFTQKPWLRDFVKLNSDLRKNAKNDLDRNLYKLVLNATFGKSMQQVRNKEDVHIVNSLNRVKNLTRQANFKRFEILKDQLVIMFRKKARIVLNKPLYVAFTVLDLSKLFMYEWHYDKIKKWYPDKKSRLLFTDTDSLAYHIETDDIFRDLYEYKQHFDFSSYDKSHPASGFLFSNTNKKVIGKMKDECEGRILYSFVGVAPKMYSFQGEKGLSKVAAKGIKKSLVSRCLNHQNFKNALFKQKKYFCHSNHIRSKNHKLFTANFKKLALHCFDSKRYLLPDGISSVPHNHFLYVKYKAPFGNEIQKYF